jgi:hypothetical protein
MRPAAMCLIGKRALCRYHDRERTFFGVAG